MPERRSIVPRNNGGEDLPIIEAGLHFARCFSMIYIGTVDDEYQGKSITLTKIYVTWELPEMMYDFGGDTGMKPRVISQEYTLSFSTKAKLRAHLESWRNKAYTEEQIDQGVDITKLVGVSCMLNISHKNSQKTGKPYAYISSISGVPKAMKENQPAAINEPFIFTYEPWDEELFKKVSEWLQKKMKETPEYKEATGQVAISPEGATQNTTNANTEEEPDDLPF
ncbi:MAG: hypothetical protein F6K19_01785 [Cyanothece sp. SIO1E1]|nr:hypothetical protein [Cyanothece sp. SIO1E1]